MGQLWENTNTKYETINMKPMGQKCDMMCSVFLANRLA